MSDIFLHKNHKYDKKNNLKIPKIWAKNEMGYYPKI